MVAKKTTPDMTSQDWASWRANLDAAHVNAERIALAFLAQAQDTPNMTVKVLAGALMISGTLTEIAAQNTGTITAPVGNPRIDRVVLNPATGAIAVVTGTPAGSPVAPAIPADRLPICRFQLSPSTTAIANSMIVDERVLGASGVPANSITLDKLSRSGTAGQVLTSGGAGADPSYQDPAGVPVGTVVPTAAIAAPSGWAFADGSTVSRTTFAALFAALSVSATVTISIASPGVVTWNGHGRSNGDIIRFATAGALPTGFVANTNYFIVNQAANTFQLAATRGGAAINTSGSQSGTHTARFAPHGHGDGSTTFNLPDMRGRTAAGRDDMGGTAANRLTTAGSGIAGVNLGDAGGTETHTLTTAQLAVHAHSGAIAVGGGAFSTGGANDAGNTNTGNAGSGNAHQNTQPTVILNYIIKTT